MFSKFYELVEGAFKDKKLSQTCYENLVDRFANDLEELEQNYLDLKHSLDHAEYYITLDRMKKGEEMQEKETDPGKKSEYRKLLNDLTIKLENLTPRGESA